MVIHAFRDCVRRTGIGQFATVVELRITIGLSMGMSRVIQYERSKKYHLQNRYIII